MEFSRQNTGMGSLSLLQGIFPTQGSIPGLLRCMQILYQLSHKRSSRILEWVAFPFSRASSQPRNQTRVSCIAGGFFTSCVVREAPNKGNAWANVRVIFGQFWRQEILPDALFNLTVFFLCTMFCCCSVAYSSLTLCNPMHCGMPGSRP